MDCSLPGSSFHRISQADSLNHSIPAAMIFFLYLEYLKHVSAAGYLYLLLSIPGLLFPRPMVQIPQWLNLTYPKQLFLLSPFPMRPSPTPMYKIAEPPLLLGTSKLPSSTALYQCYNPRAKAGSSISQVLNEYFVKSKNVKLLLMWTTISHLSKIITTKFSRFAFFTVSFK